MKLLGFLFIIMGVSVLITANPGFKVFGIVPILIGILVIFIRRKNYGNNMQEYNAIVLNKMRINFPDIYDKINQNEDTYNKYREYLRNCQHSGMNGMEAAKHIHNKL